MTRILTLAGSTTAWLLAVASAFAAVLALLSLANALHPAIDSLSHFRLHLAALAIVCAGLPLIARRWRRFGAITCLAAIAASAITLIPFMTPTAVGTAAASASEEPYRLMQANLRFDNESPEPLFALLEQARPDIVTLQEVSRVWIARLEVLQAAYPHRVICERESRLGGAAILSRFPIKPGNTNCVDDGLLAFASIEVDGQQVDVASLHLHWPWPYDQPEQAAWNARDLQRLGDTALLAGDFNAAPWSHTTDVLAEGGGLRTAGLVGPTWLRAWLPDTLRRYAGLPLDQILVKGAISVGELERGPPVGSDHLPVLMEFRLAD